MTERGVRSVSARFLHRHACQLRLARHLSLSNRSQAFAALPLVETVPSCNRIMRGMDREQVSLHHGSSPFNDHSYLFPGN